DRPHGPLGEEWLENGIGHACPKRGVRYKPNHGGVQALPEAFVIGEEESAVLLDGPAHAAAELVQAERRDVRIEGRACIQYIVAQELESRTVKRVRPRLRYDADDGPGRSALIRGIDRGTDAELPDRFQRNGQAHAHLLALLLDARGIDPIVGIVAVVDASPDESQVPLAAGAEVDRARGERHQDGPVAPVKGDVLHLM